jgi:hypothetical protein
VVHGEVGEVGEPGGFCGVRGVEREGSGVFVVGEEGAKRCGE